MTNVEIGSKDLQLSRAGVVYGVLMKLNFDEDLVLDCLRSIHSVDLVSAADWVCGLFLLWGYSSSEGPYLVISALRRGVA